MWLYFITPGNLIFCRSLPTRRFIRFSAFIPFSKFYEPSITSASARREWIIDLAKLDCLSYSFNIYSNCLECVFRTIENLPNREWVEMELFLAFQLIPVAPTALDKFYVSLIVCGRSVMAELAFHRGGVFSKAKSVSFWFAILRFRGSWQIILFYLSEIAIKSIN